MARTVEGERVIMLTIHEASDTRTFTERIARYFQTRPNQWIRAVELEPIGGRQAWRSRLSDARREFGMRIDNRWYTEHTPFGKVRRSEYRYVPAGQQELFHE